VRVNGESLTPSAESPLFDRFAGAGRITLLTALSAHRLICPRETTKRPQRLLENTSRRFMNLFQIAGFLDTQNGFVSVTAPFILMRNGLNLY
jgi:hypothetical protein